MTQYTENYVYGSGGTAPVSNLLHLVKVINQLHAPTASPSRNQTHAPVEEEVG
jgi:hypothetical protein